MQISFNPSVKSYSPNFKALDIPKITKSTHDVEMFVMDIDKGKVLKTSENIADLKAAILKAASEGKVFVSKMLQEIADEWGIK